VTIWAVRHGDDLYIRAKYRRHSGVYVAPMVAPQARATTIKLVPRATGS